MKARIQVDIEVLKDYKEDRDLYDEVVWKLCDIGNIENFEIRYDNGDIVSIVKKSKK